jgi:hypothetical protein
MPRGRHLPAPPAAGATASRHPALEGSEWERIFAKAIDAEWKPSNVGLDDIIKGAFAWGAKTVKSNVPHQATSVRLIPGRNNPEYSVLIRFTHTTTTA